MTTFLISDYSFNVSYEDSRVGAVSLEGLSSTRSLTTGFAVMEAYTGSIAIGYPLSGFSVTTSC